MLVNIRWDCGRKDEVALLWDIWSLMLRIAIEGQTAVFQLET